MDFDKLKKAAKDTLMKVTTKIEESLDVDIDISDPDADIDTAVPDSPNTAPDEEIELTQKFDLKNMLDRFKKKNLDMSIDDPDEFDATPSGDASEVTELKTSLDKLDEGISQITSNHSEQIDILKEQLEAIKTDIDDMRENSLDVATKLGNIEDGINLRLGSTEKKLAEISNSIASISKLNDSIFDLKNAQMNTRNSLTDLDTAFTKMKKKMTTSIIIMSILAAILVILEIINLLS